MYKKNKKIAIYSNAWDTNAGGGITYVLALANLLTSRQFDVTVFFFETVNETELRSRYKTGDLQIKFIERKPFPLLEQLKFAFKERLYYDIVIQQSLVAPRITLVKKSYILCDFPMKKIESLSEKIRLRTWQHVIANSEFTKHWILKRWHRSAHVIYPPIENPTELPLNKNEDWVCIGRFNEGERSKRQDIVIACFIDVIRKGKTNCKLHLIGYVGDRKFVNRLKKQAEGYPIVFHENCSLETQKEILEHSTFYISACGYKIDETKQPMFVEHYGISVVEAMAHGCIPLVIGKGGHKETVDHGINGYHWNTEEALKFYIMKLLENTSELKKDMAASAYLKSKSYDFNSVKKNVKKIF